MRSIVHSSVAKLNVSPTDLLLKSASGHLLPVAGVANMSITFDKSPFDHEFIVVEENTLPVKILLGMDFLRKFSVSLHTNPTNMFVQDEAVCLLPIHTVFPHSEISPSMVNTIRDWRVDVSDSVENSDEYMEYSCCSDTSEVIAANSVGNILLKLKGTLPYYHKDMTCFFQPKPGSTAYRYLSPGLFTISQVQNNSYVTIPYVNLSSDPVNVDPSESLGIAEIVELDSLYDDNTVEVNSVTTTPIDFKTQIDLPVWMQLLIN